MHDAAHWRRRGAEQRALAEMVDDPDVKAAILRTAE
jgi:hypothetical protein